MSTKTARLGLTKPDVTDDVTQTIKDLAKNFDLLDAMFPVGAIYQSTKPTVSTVSEVPRGLYRRRGYTHADYQ